MGDNTKIQWATATWNPMTGCTPVSEACDHCYAKAAAHLHEKVWGYDFTPTFHPGRLSIPLHWKKPRSIFVNSMSDLFHEAFTDEQIAEVWARMYQAPRHRFMVLTKRPQRLALTVDPEFVELVGQATNRMYDDPDDQYVQQGPWPPENVWLGVTVENQQRADERIPILLDTPAAVRFVSVEPMLGPVDFEHGGKSHPDWYPWDFLRGKLTQETANLGVRYTDDTPKLDWVILGGETGPRARPMQLESALDVWKHCRAAGVPFFYKQDGDFAKKHWPDTPLLGGKVGEMRATREFPQVTS